MKFSEFNLDASLQAGIQRAGYSQPTPIQIQAIPMAMAGEDLIGTAQTGTGKTAAFVLPILHKLLKGPRGKTRVLIVTPTRELAEQIHEAIRDLAAGTGLRSTTVYGGVGANPQIKALRTGVDIVVACPGRLLDLVSQRAAKLDGIEILVLDEADRMFDMGFLPDVKRILKLLPTQGQRQSALKGFKVGRYQVMIATDIAARGLDVENISHVINYDMPDTTDAYIHRIGRTGRAERLGDAFTLVTPEDGSTLRALEKVMGKPIERRKLEGFDYGAVSAPEPRRDPVYAGRPNRPARNGRRGETYAKRLAS